MIIPPKLVRVHPFRKGKGIKHILLVRSLEGMDHVHWVVLQSGVSSVDFVSIESLVRRSTRSCQLGSDAKCTSSSFHINYRLPVQSSGAFSVKFSFRGKKGIEGLTGRVIIASDKETVYAKSEFFSACTGLAYSSKAIKTIQHGNTHDVDLLYI